MQKASKFTFGNYAFNPNTGLLTSEYIVAFVSGLSDTYVNNIQIDKPNLAHKWSQVPPQLQSKLLQSLHLMFGIVYWKLHCAPEISIEHFSINQQQKNFWDTLYTKGLGEFFYVNKIDFRGLVNFPFSDKAAESIIFPRSDRAIVGVGGGKDSLVAMEILKQGSVFCDGFVLNNSLIQQTAADLAKVNLHTITWRIDSKLFQLSRSGEVYEGHIPYTALYNLVGVFMGVVFDYKFVVFGNERSASAGNLSYLDHEINHQWSKSHEFEILFQDYVHRHLTPSVVPFSILRPFSELEIVRQFSSQPEYFGGFSSCNENFRSDFSQRYQTFPYWCGQCPKCLFVFVCLSAFLNRETLENIFGQNLYENEKLIPLTEELLGIKNHKPMECVGTPEEMLMALSLAQENEYYRNSAVMLSVSRYLYSREQDLKDLKTQVFSHNYPKSWPQGIVGRIEARSLS